MFRYGKYGEVKYSGVPDFLPRLLKDRSTLVARNMPSSLHTFFVGMCTNPVLLEDSIDVILLLWDHNLCQRFVFVYVNFR